MFPLILSVCIMTQIGKEKTNQRYTDTDMKFHIYTNHGEIQYHCDG